MDLIGNVELSAEQYHAAEGVSKSMLDQLAVSPKNFWDQYINPDREPREEKHCFLVGEGTHKLILEPDQFADQFAIGFDKSAYPDALNTADDMKQVLAAEGMMTSGSKPELARRLVEEAGYSRGKILMYLEQDYTATLGDKTIIPAKDYKDMLGMLRGIQADPTAAGMIKGARIEQSYFAYDERGTLRRGRMDGISADGSVIFDVKTTLDVSPEAFGRTIADRRYHVQAAYYLDLIRLIEGDAAPKYFAFIAVQKSRPYDVGVYFLTDEQIHLGRLLYTRDLLLLEQCLQRNYWPGVTGGEVMPAQLPEWEMRKVRQLEEQLEGVL